MTDKKIVNLYQKFHLRIIKGDKKFRLKCLELVDEKLTDSLDLHNKGKSKFGEHESEWLMAHKLQDLPANVLALATVKNTESHHLKIITSDFVDLLDEFKTLRQSHIDKEK